ncbi:MAG: helix-turn-helix domain-containing protein [Candidatus Azobacteroides sp.]|nr:helix-turn-helix domain-containing protein [Candidatus Azobacteroides sp.]
MSEETTTSCSAVHHGRNIRRLREMLGVKQEAIAIELNITQQAMSKLERKEQIEDEILEKVAKVLKVPVESIKNFNDEFAINVIANTFNDTFNENSSFIAYKPTFNPIDKVIELYERMLKSEQEKVALLEKMLEGKISDKKIVT